MPHSFTASAPGRVCFAGEDIDWISGPSVLCAINLRVTAEVMPLSQDLDFLLLRAKSPFYAEHRILLSELGCYKKHILDYVHGAIKVISDFGVRITPIQITIASQLPARAGLSSSAAVIVSTLAALNGFFNLALSEYEICTLAHAVESKELKTGAGQMDFYSCALGGLLYLNSICSPPDPIERYEFPSNLKIIIVDTLTPRNTADVINCKRKRLLESDKLILTYIKYTEKAIEKMHKLLQLKRMDKLKLGNIITSCHGYLRDYMRVSTKLLDTCVEICLENGALGAKLTGTGMGGCMFAIVPKAKVLQIEEAIINYPVKYYIVDPSHQGIINYNY